jgi:hydrogenase expression/formation protein HypC
MCLAVPGKIINISGDDSLSRMGNIDFSGIKKAISLAYFPEARINDYVIVHAGFAISIIDEEDARESLNAFQELDDLEANQ